MRFRLFIFMILQTFIKVFYSNFYILHFTFIKKMFFKFLCSTFIEILFIKYLYFEFIYKNRKDLNLPEHQMRNFIIFRVFSLVMLNLPRDIIIFCAWCPQNMHSTASSYLFNLNMRNFRVSEIFRKIWQSATEHV